MQEPVDFGTMSIHYLNEGNKTRLVIRGDVDENFKRSKVPLPTSANIIIDMKEVINFNSCGIREWSFFVNDLGKQCHITYENCSVSFIDQVNMVPESQGPGVIASFFAPYYCSSHGEVVKLITYRDLDNIKISGKAPEYKCDDCKKPLEFDALEESYFLFITQGIANAS